MNKRHAFIIIVVTLVVIIPITLHYLTLRTTSPSLNGQSNAKMGTVKISSFDVGTLNKSVINVYVTIINGGSVVAENISLVINVTLWYGPHFNASEIKVKNLWIEGLDVNDAVTIKWDAHTTTTSWQHFDAFFTVYVNGTKTDERSYGCY